MLILKKKTIKKLDRILPAIEVSRFIQIQESIQTFMDCSVAERLPLAE